jgi:hypothetical protein
MFFLTSKGQSTSRSDIDATARYLQPEFDIENPRPASASPPASPSTRSRATSETALIYQRERPPSAGAVAVAPALACPVPERGRAWLARAQGQAGQTQAEQPQAEQTEVEQTEVEQTEVEQTQAPVAPVIETAVQSEAAPIRYRDYQVRPLTPDCVPDTMTVGVCMLASLGGLIGGLAAAYVPK